MILIDHNDCFRIELFGGTTLSELVVVYNKQMKKGGKKKEQKWGARIPKVVISAETNNGVAELAHYSIH